MKSRRRSYPRHDTSQKSPELLPGIKHLWIHSLKVLGAGFVIGLAVMLLGSLVWFFIRGAPSSPVSHKDEKAPQVQAPTRQSQFADLLVASTIPADPTIILKRQLQQIISEIREANQKKDLSMLLRYYSPNFPDLPQRTQSISKAWRIYDYPKIEFEIKEVKLLADNTAIARVKWDVEAKNISTKKAKNISKTYLIGFANESGQWRIKSLETVE